MSKKVIKNNILDQHTALLKFQDTKWHNYCCLKYTESIQEKC